LYRSLPDAEFHLIDDCGHCAPEERPAEVAAHLVDFFARRGPRRVKTTGPAMVARTHGAGNGNGNGHGDAYDMAAVDLPPSTLAGPVVGLPAAKPRPKRRRRGGPGGGHNLH
ncbi:MAG TPA: alpha/beta hydrolase, partial [Vulgatibacter sp.]